MSDRPPESIVRPDGIMQDACQRLQQLSLKHPTEAEEELVVTLGAIMEAPPAPEILFPLLEDIRAPFCFVREAAVRHYLDKAPHLDSAEEAHFQHSIDAAQLMMRGYVFCARLEGTKSRAKASDEATWARQAATVLHRCLHYSAMVIFEHYRAKRELPPGTWSRHHSLFASANRLGLATLPIEDRVFDEVQTTHCQAAYALPLLAELARPYGRNPRDLNFIWSWSEQLAQEVRLAPVWQQSALAGHIVEFDQDAPPRPVQLVKPSKSTVRMDTSSVTGRIRQVLDKLAHGALPERLGLCPESVDNSRRLLAELLGLWSLEAPARQQPRTRQGSHARVCTGFAAIHHFVLGSETGAACLAQLKRLEGLEIHHHDEEWEVVDRCPTGIRLACSATNTRVANQQLIALRPDGSGSYLFGQVEWLKREQGGRLLAGIGIFPGTPQAVCVRMAPQVRGQKGLFVRAFVLRGESGLPEEASIFLPAGMPSSEGPVEMLYEECSLIRLGDEMARGLDFVQAGFTAL